MSCRQQFDAASWYSHVHVYVSIVINLLVVVSCFWVDESTKNIFMPLRCVNIVQPDMCQYFFQI